MEFQLQSCIRVPDLEQVFNTFLLIIRLTLSTEAWHAVIHGVSKSRMLLSD